MRFYYAIRDSLKKKQGIPDCGELRYLDMVLLTESYYS